MKASFYHLLYIITFYCASMYNMDQKSTHPNSCPNIKEEHRNAKKRLAEEQVSRFENLINQLEYQQPAAKRKLTFNNEIETPSITNEWLTIKMTLHMINQSQKKDIN